MARAAATSTATLAQLKALADPLRYRILENLLAQPRSPRQMARDLRTHPTRLYHHFRVLERAGLIRITSTRQKRGTIEKYFQAAVDRLEVGAQSAGAQTALAPALLQGVLASTLADVQRAVAPRRPHWAQAAPYVKRYRIRATSAQAASIRAQLDKLAELCERASAGEGNREFGLTLAFYESPDRVKRRKTR